MQSLGIDVKPDVSKLDFWIFMCTMLCFYVYFYAFNISLVSPTLKSYLSWFMLLTMAETIFNGKILIVAAHL